MSKPNKKAANQKPGKIVLLPVEQIEPSPFQARTAFDTRAFILPRGQEARVSVASSTSTRCICA